MKGMAGLHNESARIVSVQRRRRAGENQKETGEKSRGGGPDKDLRARTSSLGLDKMGRPASRATLARNILGFMQLPVGAKSLRGD